MTKSHRNTLIIFSLLVAFVLAGSGCAPGKSQFRTSFLPPSPRGGDDAGEIVVISEPRLDPSLYTHEMPVVIPAATLIPPHSPEIESRLRDAEEKFDAGKMA